MKQFVSRRFASRLSNVKQVCNKYRDSNPVFREMNSNPENWKDSIYFNFRHGYLWCTVHKAGSTSILTHLMATEGLNFTQFEENLFKDENITRTHSRKFIHNRLFFLPTDVSVADANSRLLSFSFVRHPFARIVSAYNDQIIRRPNWPVIKVFLEKVRQINLTYPELYAVPLPSPLEVVQYLLEANKELEIEKIDSHWRPQWTFCPYCSLNFDLIGRLEEFQSEFLFLAKKLEFKISFNFRESPSNESEKLRNFFSQVPKRMIEDLYQVFKIDFEMFNYTRPNDIIEMGSD